MKRVAVLGSTGSIGTQTLDIIRANGDALKVVSLVAYSDKEKLERQSREFSPRYSALIAESGEECLTEAVKGADIAVVATRGIAAIEAILYCLSNGIDVALANKEALVCAGELIMRQKGARVLPVDSEHCAIGRCLLGRSSDKTDKILLTASGGPFYDLPKDALSSITATQALKHPNWHMGSKITIDSATMMNKSLEVVEAKFLFGVPVDKIQIVVHRQSIVHSLVQFDSGEVAAQLASPDMRLPIQIALLGDDGKYVCQNIDFSRLMTLTFEKPDFEKFPCARLGYEIDRYPPLCRTVMNSANDVCVERFLNGRFSFCDFYNTIVKTVDHFREAAANAVLDVRNIKNFDTETRLYVNNLLDGVQC